MSDYRQETSPSFHLDHAWNTAINAAYHEVVIEYGNDGPIENDQHLPVAEQDARDHAIAALARDTGVHPDFVRDRVENNAWAYGQGYDEQADAYLRPPDWSDMTNWYADATDDRDERAFWDAIDYSKLGDSEGGAAEDGAGS